MSRVCAALTVVMCLLVVPVVGYEITDWYKLGAVQEGATFIPDGPHAESIAFVDGWGLYIHSLDGGGYTKLWKVDALPFNMSPRGVAYLSQGAYAGNFLFSDKNTSLPPASPAPLVMVSADGAFLGRVSFAAPIPQSMAQGEGLTQITSGPHQGKIAFLGAVKPGYVTHLYILRLEGTASGIVAFVDVDINLQAIGVGGGLAVAFLDAGYPAETLRNTFVVSGYSPQPLAAIAVSADGTTQRRGTFPAAASFETLAYISTGARTGNVFVADHEFHHVAVRSVDGVSQSPVSIQVGLGLAGSQKIFWLTERQQFMDIAWDGNLSSYPWYLVTRDSQGGWHLAEHERLSGLRIATGMTDLTVTRNYYLLGQDSSTTAAPYKVHVLDEDMAFVREIALPSQCYGTYFGRIVYRPGPTPAEDRFLLTAKPTYNGPAKAIYVFDAAFDAYPPEIVDLSAKVTTSIDGLVYDPAVERYYVMDGTRILRVFDSSWNQIDWYDLGDVCPRGLSSLTKLTSGELSGSIALLSALDNEILVIDYERDIVTAQVGNLLEDVSGGQPAADSEFSVLALDASPRSGPSAADVADGGGGASLVRKLENVRASIERENMTAAINQMQAFQHEVRAQRGKSIPPTLADAWLKAGDDVIRALRLL